MPRIHFWSKSLWEIVISSRFRAWFALRLGLFLDEDALFKCLRVLKPKRIFPLNTMIQVGLCPQGSSLTPFVTQSALIGWLHWPRHRTLHQVQSPVPVKTGWWVLWEELWEEGFGVTDDKLDMSQQCALTGPENQPVLHQKKHGHQVWNSKFWIMDVFSMEACTAVSTCQLFPCYLHNEST